MLPMECDAALVSGKNAAEPQHERDEKEGCSNAGGAASEKKDGKATRNRKSDLMELCALLKDAADWSPDEDDLLMRRVEDTIKKAKKYTLESKKRHLESYAQFLYVAQSMADVAGFWCGPCASQSFVSSSVHEVGESSSGGCGASEEEADWMKEFKRGSTSAPNSNSAEIVAIEGPQRDFKMRNYSLEARKRQAYQMESASSAAVGGGKAGQMDGNRSSNGNASDKRKSRMVSTPLFPRPPPI